MDNMFNGATNFNQTIQYWLLTSAGGVPTFNNMLASSGLVGNSYGLTTPTPSKSEFDQVRPSETIPDGSLSTVLSQWLADPTALQFTYQNNTPWYNTINIWNTTLITDMSNLFLNNTTFNQAISNWDTSNVTNMSSMFQGASTFNQDISGWDVTNVQNMTSMFQTATSFNQSIGTWGTKTSNVTNMTSMFQGATSFNKSCDAWTVSSVTNMTSIFREPQHLGKILIVGMSRM